MGKGSALANLGELNDAINKYDEAIEIWEDCLQRNESFVLPNLFTVLFLRDRDLIKKEEWQLIGESVNKTFKLYLEVLEYPDFSDHFKSQINNECKDIIRRISK